MAIAFRSVSSAAGAAVTSRPTTLPSGAAAGDTLVLGVLSEGPDVSGAISPGTGWTRIAVLFDAAKVWVGGVWVRVHDGSAAPTVTWGGTSRYTSYVMAAYSGADRSSPVQTSAAVQQSTASTRVAVPTLTTTQPDELLVCVAMNDFGQSTNGSGAWNKRVDIVEGAILDLAIATPGSTGSQTLTQSTAVAYMAFAIALQQTALASGRMLGMVI